MTLALSFITCIAFAQAGISSRLTLSGGSATDVTGVTTRAASISPSVWISPSSRVVLGLTGSGTTFHGGAWSAAGGASALTRVPIGPAAFTMDGRVAYTTTSYELSYLSADVIPMLAFGAGPLSIFGGGHLSRATRWETLQMADPLPGGLPGGPLRRSRESSSRQGRALLYGGQLNGRIDEVARFFLIYREERGNVAEEMQVDRSLTAGISRGILTLSGSAALRDVADERSPGGSALLSMAFSPAVSFDVATGRYPMNRLTGSSAGRFLNAGLSIRVGGGGSALAAPAGVPAPLAGMTRLAIAARDASRVEVAGDFTNWEFVVTKRAANGVWYVDLTVPPGQYRYAFRIDGKEWRIPDGAPAAEDEFGGKSAWLTVARNQQGDAR